jgi:hypothetical protein
MKFFILSLSLFSSISTFAGPLDFKSTTQINLQKICSEVCGEKYTANVQIRDFYQLKIYPDKINQAGLLCSQPVEWKSKGTPCHKRKAYLGIHQDGLAPEKTEIHRGAWSVERGGAWCIAYNEDDFKGMKKAIKAGKFKPGQVACMSGMTLDSIEN